MVLSVVMVCPALLPLLHRGAWQECEQVGAWLVPLCVLPTCRPTHAPDSCSLNAMAVFESGYKDDLTREEAVDLVARAIR